MEGETVIVETTYGPIMGIKKESVMEKDIIRFHKIPYAKPPIGNLRFKDPEPPEIWAEVLDGTTEGTWCYGVHKLFENLTLSEDSLHINVYTKNLKPSKPLPVMVFLHGGGFSNGSGSALMYGPDYLLEKDIVLVTLNYRLGFLGFLSFDDPSLEVPGNAGLKDQCLALKWVTNNILRFGGDPNNITLFGESAGGCSVHFHMLSEMSKGLFHKAILMSGTALNYWSTTTPRNWGERLATALGWDGEGGHKQALKVLRDTTAEQIIEAQENLLPLEERMRGILLGTAPVIEPYISEQCFIPMEPIKMCLKPWSSEIPILIGGNSDEGMMLSYPAVKENPEILDMFGNCENIVPFELGLSITDEKCKQFGLSIKNFYFGESKPTLEKYTELLSDRMFWHGIYRSVLSRLNHPNSGPTYLYRFNVDSPTFNHYRIFACGPEARGVCHADDISYLFKNNFSEKLESDRPEYLAIQRMVGIWTQFALTGNPNASIIAPTVWNPLIPEDLPLKCLNISNELEVIKLPETERIKFWDAMY